MAEIFQPQIVFYFRVTAVSNNASVTVILVIDCSIRVLYYLTILSNASTIPDFYTYYALM